MQGLVFVFCAMTSAASAFLLWRASQGAKVRLLFWAALCFLGMTVNNILLFVDVIVGTGLDLSLFPHLAALVSIVLLNVGLIWETT
jgi:hypothetical protein